MIVKANSVTFLDGSKPGPLVVSPVHIDRLPMVPPGGSATFLDFVLMHFANRSAAMFVDSSILQIGILLVSGTLLCACERNKNWQLTVEKKQIETFEFLQITKFDLLYREKGRYYWCSSPSVRANRPHGDSYMPDVPNAKNYVSFGGDSVDKPSFSSIVVVNDHIAYSTSFPMVTFDACMTRIHFNISPYPSFKDAMQATPIRYPTPYLDTDSEVFFTSLTPHPNGGCFHINPKRVSEPTAYFYCTNDFGKTWSLQTTLDRAQHKPTESVSKSK